MSDARLVWKHWALLAVVALLAFLPGFISIPPFDRDESRYVQASRQMLETGDYVDIRFQDEARHKKPVGIYWMQAATVHLLTGGADNGPIALYRLPSLVGAVAGVLLTAWVGLALFGPGVGLAAGLMMATCVILGVEARMAKTDAMQFACVMACMGVLARAYLRPDRALGLGTALLFWAALGVGILVKGVILMVVGTALLALWLMDRDAWWMRRLRPGIGLPLMLAIILPWLIAIAIATKGAFFSYAIGHEFLGKAGTGQENHAGPPGYFLATFWISFWPWAPLVLLALPWIRRHWHAPAVRFCLAWIIPTWVIHEIVVTKLPHYTLPVLPALAMLAMAAADARWRTGEGRSAGWRWATIILALLVAAAFAAIIVGFPLQLTGGIVPIAVVGGVFILAVSIFLLLLDRRGEVDRWGRAALLGTLVVYMAVFGMALPNLTPMWISPQVRQAFDTYKPCPNSILSAGGYNEPSMVFLVGTATRLGGGEMVAGEMLADPACSIGLLAVGREEEAFKARLTAAGLVPRQVAELSGFNYPRGKKTVLHLYVAAPATRSP